MSYAGREAPARRADWKRLALIAAAGVAETTAASAADPALARDVDRAKDLLRLLCRAHNQTEAQRARNGADLPL